MRRASLALLLGLFAGVALAHAGEGKPRPVSLHHSDDALRATYREGVARSLPRLLLFDAAGQVLLVETGLSDGVGRRLSKALDKDRPLALPLTLETVLTETLDAQGRPVTVADLPKADGYVVDYWAEWCKPCRLLDRDLERQLARWDRHVVWLKIESDPQKLPENRQ